MTTQFHKYPIGRVLCVIINQVNFLIPCASKEYRVKLADRECFQVRQGTIEDEKALCDSLKNYNLDIKLERDLTASEIIQFIGEIKEEVCKVDYPYAGLILLAMSHGTQTDNKDFMLGTDRVMVDLEDIYSPFHNETCPGLNGKPKVFLFSCCRGSHSNNKVAFTEAIETTKKGVDAPEAKRGPMKMVKDDSKVELKKADYMLVFSTVGGFESERRKHGEPKVVPAGTGLIQSFCVVVNADVSKGVLNHMAKLIEATKFKLSNEYGTLVDRQVIEVRDTLTKHFYLEENAYLRRKFQNQIEDTGGNTMDNKSYRLDIIAPQFDDLLPDIIQIIFDHSEDNYYLQVAQQLLCRDCTMFFKSKYGAHSTNYVNTPESKCGKIKYILELWQRHMGEDATIEKFIYSIKSVRSSKDLIGMLNLSNRPMKIKPFYRPMDNDEDVYCHCKVGISRRSIDGIQSLFARITRYFKALLYGRSINRKFSKKVIVCSILILFSVISLLYLVKYTRRSEEKLLKHVEQLDTCARVLACDEFLEHFHSKANCKPMQWTDFLKSSIICNNQVKNKECILRANMDHIKLFDYNL